MSAVLERCPSYRKTNRRSKERQGSTGGRCPFYGGVRLIEVSVKIVSAILPALFVSL